MKKRVFLDIGEAVTMAGAAKKRGVGVNESDMGLIQDAVLVTVDGLVAWIGRRDEFERSGFRQAHDFERVSLAGRSIAPGFVECHTHLVFAGDRKDEFEWRMSGQTYSEIAARGGGIRSTVRATRQASEGDLVTVANRRASRFVAQGVTTLECKSGYGLDLETELRILRTHRRIIGPRIVSTYLGAHAVPAEFASPAEYVEFICEQVLPEIHRLNLADRVDIYIESGFFSEEHAHRYFAKALSLGLPICAHVEQLSASGGIEACLNSSPQSLDHVVFASAGSIQKMAQTQVPAVLLPTSDLYLRMQYPPARQLIDQGCCVALATDFNPGTSPTQDLSLVGVLARLQMQMTLPEVWAAYTVGAARALSKEKQLGSLEVGKECDFSVLDGTWKDLFYAVGEHPVVGVVRSGEWLKPCSMPVGEVN